jgi:hypothetical protein
MNCAAGILLGGHTVLVKWRLERRAVCSGSGFSAGRRLHLLRNSSGVQSACYSHVNAVSTLHIIR